MLIPARYLVDRMRHVRSRADELRAVRRRLVAEPRRGGDREVELAARLRRLRRELSDAIGPLGACATCAGGSARVRPDRARISGRRAGRPGGAAGPAGATDAAGPAPVSASGPAWPGASGQEPNTRWSGGYCCGGATDVLFSDDELSALRQAGTTAGQLRAPRSDHAGCAFRGPTGCSLPAEHRPNRCVIFLCTEAARELYDRGALDHIERLADRLSDTFAAFSRERARRLLDEALPVPAHTKP